MEKRGISSPSAVIDTRSSNASKSAVPAAAPLHFALTIITASATSATGNDFHPFVTGVKKRSPNGLVTKQLSASWSASTLPLPSPRSDAGRAPTSSPSTKVEPCAHTRQADVPSLSLSTSQRRCRRLGSRISSHETRRGPREEQGSCSLDYNFQRCDSIAQNQSVGVNR